MEGNQAGTEGLLQPHLLERISSPALNNVKNLPH